MVKRVLLELAYLSVVKSKIDAKPVSLSGFAQGTARR